MAYRNRVFVSFDGDNDIHYYRLLRAWKQNDSSPFTFADAHDINTALDSSTEETIKRRLGERLATAKVVVSLVGERTRYQHRFVRWELERALQLGLPIIAVNLNGLRSQDSERCPPVIRDQLVVHISFNAAILQFALENWPAEFSRLRASTGSGARYYNSDVFKRLGL